MPRDQREEKEFTKNFVKRFYRKFNYYPTVIINKERASDDYNLLSLSQLEECFTPFLPTLRNKIIPLNSRERIREITELRHVFCFLARSMNFKVTTIGRYLGGRDHTTVVHSVMVFKNLYETDEAFREKFKRITNHIKQKYESSIMEHVDQAWN
jgi:hypothetical protein